MLDLSWQQWLILYVAAMALFLWWWASQKPARDLQEYWAGFHYAQAVLERCGDSWATRERLWNEYETGMTFDPGPYERGMRKVLDSLVPLKDPTL